MREYSLGKRLIENYVNQPYSWFLNQNTANLGKTILSEVSQVVGGTIMPFLNIVAQGFVVISITILIFIIIIVLLFLIMRSDRLKKFSYIFITGGAFGNLFDRVMYNSVPDFIDFHINEFHFEVK